ncbi:unnamed protein product, partial [Ectocarpus sp. 12 AP-2014]
MEYRTTSLTFAHASPTEQYSIFGRSQNALVLSVLCWCNFFLAATPDTLCIRRRSPFTMTPSDRSPPPRLLSWYVRYNSGTYVKLSQWDGVKSKRPGPHGENCSNRHSLEGA